MIGYEFIRALASGKIAWPPQEGMADNYEPDPELDAEAMARVYMILGSFARHFRPEIQAAVKEYVVAMAERK